MSDFRDYAGVDFSREFLAHYGKGHLDGGKSGRYKWGSGDRPYQRTSMEGKGGDDEERVLPSLSGTSGRYPWSDHRREDTARQGLRKLNKLDKQQAKLKIELSEANRKYQKAANRHGADSEKAKEREAELQNVLKEYNASVEDTNRTIQSLTEQGFTIDSKETRRMSMSGKQLALAAISAIGPVGIVSFNSVSGRKYKVRDNQDDYDEAIKADIDGDEYAESMAKARSKEKQAQDEYDKAYRDAYEFKDNSKATLKDLDAKKKTVNDAAEERAKLEERVKDFDENRVPIKKGGLFGKSKKQKQREREERWQNEVQKTIDEMSKGSESDKAWAKYLSFDLDSVKSSYKRKEDYERDREKALEDHTRIKRQENNARDKSKMPTSSGLTESQKKAFNQAKNEDKWSIDFLEVADPENEWSDQKMLREYKEYLKDPEGWMTRR